MTSPSRTERFVAIGRMSAQLMLGMAAVIVAIMLIGGVDAVRERLDETEPPTMELAGAGEVDVPPTGAMMGVDLKGCAKGPSGSLLESSSSLAAVTRSLRASGIPADDISQGGARTGREYGPKPRWCTYLEVDVRVRDLDDLPEVVQAVGTVRRGVAGLSGPTFEYGADGKLEQQALAEAVAAARAKAEDAAEQTGMRVTGVETVTEGEAGVTRPDERGEMELRYRSADLAGGAADGLTAAKAQVTAVSRNAGRATAYASVNVIFTLERDDE